MNDGIILNKAGVRSFLHSPEIRNIVEEQARKVKDRCGTGYNMDVSVQSTRVIASVYTETKSAAKDNRENNTLLKAVSHHD